MTRIKSFDMEGTLRLLEEVEPSSLAALTYCELEWVLADFVLSWGQRMLLDPTSWPTQNERVYGHRFGRRYLPFQLAPDFPGVSPEQVRILALATSSHALFILLLDESIDAPETAPAATKLALQHLLAHSYRWYRALFPADSAFWVAAERRARITTQAMWQEYYQHNGQVHPFSGEEFRRIAADKVAVAHINFIGLAILNGTPELIPCLIPCWDAIGLAATVLDDLRDWASDYQARNFTYLLSQVLRTPPLATLVANGELPSLLEVGGALFCSPVMEELCDLAQTELQLAAQHARDLGCMAFADLADQAYREVQAAYLDLTQRKLTALMTRS